MHHSNTDPSLEQDEEFLFEKGDLNLWAEPLQWARLLHRHLCVLSTVPGSPSLCPAELDRFSAIAGAYADSALRATSSLPVLPQFSATIEHAKLSLLNERARLAQNVLSTMRRKTDSSWGPEIFQLPLTFLTRSSKWPENRFFPFNGNEEKSSKILNDLGLLKVSASPEFLFRSTAADVRGIHSLCDCV